MLIRYLGTNPTIDLLNNSPTFNDMNIKKLRTRKGTYIVPFSASRMGAIFSIALQIVFTKGIDMFGEDEARVKRERMMLEEKVRCLFLFHLMLHME